MFELRMAEHDIHRGRQIVEVWDGATLMGAIYPTERGVKVISKFLVGREPQTFIEIERRPPAPEIPAILIHLRPAP